MLNHMSNVYEYVLVYNFQGMYLPIDFWKMCKYIMFLFVRKNLTVQIGAKYDINVCTF